MRDKRLLAAGIALTLIGLMGLLAVGVTTAARPMMGGRGGRGVDAMFIEQMVPHHDDAIEMAEMAIERGEHEEVRELARTIKKTQTEENERMRAWYEDWYGREVPRVRQHMGSMSDMEALEEAEDFDKEFIEQMVPHHQMAVMMARMAGARTQREEMRDLTDSIVRSQSAEIEDMRRWYSEWYE